MTVSETSYNQADLPRDDPVQVSGVEPHYVAESRGPNWSTSPDLASLLLIVRDG
jgi:hypothetical protein